MHVPRSARIPVVLLGLIGCAPAAPPPAAIGDSPAGVPPLVMLVVVDQLRADLLDKYDNLLTGGFRRLRDNGYSYVNASHAHAATETAVGHASLATGAYPDKHGIIGNAFYVRRGAAWALVSNVGDSTVKVVGAPSSAGVSPVNLMRSGLAEWLKAADPKSIVASVAGKDRGAVQPAARTRGAYVYWFDSGAGRYVTSTWYRSSDPDWITRFNATTLQAHRADTVWDLRVPAGALGRANRDTIPTEGNGTNTFFPHRFSVETSRPESFWPWWSATPYHDEATLQLAREMVRSLGLGRDASPDFLNVSLSVTDYVGHAYGPNSREQLDNLLRLDRQLGDYFTFLDETVGKGRWTMLLSADHGAMDTPEDYIARGEFGYRATPADLAKIDTLRRQAVANPDAAAGARWLAAEMKKNPLVVETYTHESLLVGQPRDSFEVLERRSIFPGRVSGLLSREGVEIRFRQGVLRSPRGSTHGTPWWYDRHVPMIFMGPGIAAGRDTSRAETVDFAPTAATWLRIPFPADLDGKVLSAVVRR
jgi:predicted AlkP superfamily pyrophosphatase or phosphodiesterase